METAEKDTRNADEFIDAKDIAEVHDLHIESVRRMAREGRIDAVRVGGRWRFPARLIRDPMNENE